MWRISHNKGGVRLEGYAKQKIPGGKMLAIRVWYGDRLEKIEISGDFFMHPESTLEKIESVLIGAKVNEKESILIKLINNVIMSENAELVGITPEAIASAVKAAIG